LGEGGWADETQTERFGPDGRVTEGNAPVPCLVVLSGTQLGEVISLREGQQRIGRADDAEVCLRDSSVSRYHAMIEVKANKQSEIVDLGSTNGTFVNGAAVQRSALNVGDRVQIGKMSILKFEYHGSVEEDYHEHLFQAGTHDQLTGVFNRRFLEEHLEADFRLAVRHREDLSLVVFDVDHFKLVNDNSGHLMGDAVLRQVAEIIRDRIRTEDILGRYGGDEFVLVLRRTSLEGATILAGAVCARVRGTAIAHRDKTMHLTVSAGIATQSVNTPYESWTAMFDAADHALLRAKEMGRDRMEIVKYEHSAASAKVQGRFP